MEVIQRKFAGNIFKIIISLTQQVTAEADERSKQIIEFCQTAKTSTEIMSFLGLTHKEHFRVDILLPLLNKGILLPTIPDKPNSPKQKYYSKTKYPIKQVLN